MDPQRVDGDKIVGLVADTARIEVLKRRVGDGRRLERVAWPVLDHARRLVLVPGLAGRDLQLLPRTRRIVEQLLRALVALPRELVIVPHGHEGPTRARILQVGIGEHTPIGGPIIVEIGREVEVVQLLAVRVADDVAKPPAAIDAAWRVFGIFHDLVDEVAQMQHEAQTFRARPPHVLVDHAPVGVERAIGDVLAADEGELHGTVVAWRRRGQRAADAAHVSRVVDEAIPILARGLQTGGEETARPVRGRAHLHIAARDHVREALVVRDLHHQPVRPGAGVRRAARPQDHAVGRRISGRHALRVEVASFRARSGGRMRTALAEGQSRAKARGLGQQRPARCLSAHPFPSAWRPEPQQQ